MEADLLDKCCLVGSRTTPQEIEALLANPDVGPDWLISTLSTHKAFTYFNTVVTSAARALPESSPIAAALRSVEGDVSRCEDHLGRVVQEADALVDAGASPSLVLIKGLSNARFYSKPGVRWTKDVDLFVPDWHSLMALTDSLLDRGYIFDGGECPWIKADKGHGRDEYGQFSLVKRDPEDVIRFDIHFGTYSVSFNQYLRLSLADFAVSGPKGAFLDKTATLIVMFAHALSDGYVSVKDVNDAAAMATSEGEIDWGRLSVEVAAHDFQPQAQVLADQLMRSYDNPAIESFATKLRADRRGKRLFGWQMHNRNWRRRAVVNTVYTYRATRRRQPALAGLRALQCYAFFVRRLRIRPAPRSLLRAALLLLAPKTRLVGWDLRPDACLMLVPAWHGAVRELASGQTPTPRRLLRHQSGPDRVQLVIRGRRGVLVQIGQAMFLPTWDLVIDRLQLRALAATAGEGAPSNGG